MIKIFAKTILNNKIVKTYKYVNEEDFEIDHFYDYVHDICEHFDSPTPIIMAKHIKDYILFNNTQFLQEDFVEKIFFDKLILETYKGI